MIQLPPPRLDGAMSLERSIDDRRSIREFSDQPLTLGELSDLLWSISGITDAGTGYRATPSAGAIYPLELWVLVSRVEGLEPARHPRQAGVGQAMVFLQRHAGGA